MDHDSRITTLEEKAGHHFELINSTTISGNSGTSGYSYTYTYSDYTNPSTHPILIAKVNVEMTLSTTVATSKTCDHYVRYQDNQSGSTETTISTSDPIGKVIGSYSYDVFVHQSVSGGKWLSITTYTVYSTNRIKIYNERYCDINGTIQLYGLKF